MSIKPPSEQDLAPDFSLSNQENQQVTLSQFIGQWVVLYFYPKDNTPGCSLEASDFSHLKADFEKRNAVILGISKDSVKSHANFCEKKHLTITLLSDTGTDVQKSYGVFQKKKFMGREYMGTVRSTFLINPEGYIAKVWYNVKALGHAKKVLDFLDEITMTKVI